MINFSTTLPTREVTEFSLHIGTWMFCFGQKNQLVENVNNLSRHFRKALQGEKKIWLKPGQKKKRKKSTASPISIRICPGSLDYQVWLWALTSALEIGDNFALSLLIVSLSQCTLTHCILHSQLSDLKFHFLTSPLDNNTWHHILLWFGLVWFGFCLFNHNVVPPPPGIWPPWPGTCQGAHELCPSGFPLTCSHLLTSFISLAMLPG